MSNLNTATNATDNYLPFGVENNMVILKIR